MATIIDLKRVRESANPSVSQSELGRRLGKDQAQISRWERDPASVPVGVVQDICEALGLDVAQVLAESRDRGPSGLDTGDPYADRRATYYRLSERLDEGTGTDPEVLDTLPDPMPTRRDVADRLAPLVRKPLVGVFGAFDAGKSTLINSLLGRDVLPTGYSPLTRIPLYVRHLDDRPEWMREDETWLFTEDWNPALWRDEEHCTAHRIVAGGRTTLEQHASHRGISPDESHAASGMLFVDSPLLLVCDLIDSPGYDNDATDDQHARDSISRVDVGIYCSAYIGFMDAGDILRSGRLARTLPSLDLPDVGPLPNLYFVATHVREDDPAEAVLEDIFDAATGRCWRLWSETLVPELSAQAGREVDEHALRGRFFAFSKQSERRSEALLRSLKELLGESIPTMRRKVADDLIDDLRAGIDKAADQVLVQYASMRQDRHEAEEELAWLLENEADRQRDAKEARKRFHVFVDRARVKSRADFTSKAQTLVASAHVRKVVDSFDGHKKEAQKGALAVVVEELQATADRVCARESSGIEDEVSRYLAVFGKATTREGRVLTPFNIEGAFIGGMAGLAGVGALAVWAGTLGNLGAYILAAKFTSLLATLGISISGGTATVVSAMAAVGGPITIGIAIVALAAIAGLALFGSWEGRLTKAIVSTLKRKKIVAQFESQIESYWDDTAAAFDTAADTLEAEYEAHLVDLGRLAREVTDEELDRVIEGTTTASYWYRSLPW